MQNLKKNSLIENTFENVEERKVLLKDKLLHFFADDFTKKLILLFIFVVIRLLEYSFFRITHNEIGFELFFNRSLNYDFLLVLQFSSVMLIPLLFSFLTNFKLYSIINVSFCFFIILVNISLTHFFLTNETLLTYQFSEFSFDEICKIIFNELTVNRIWLWTINVIVIALSAYMFFFFKFNLPIKFKKISIPIYLILIVVSLVNLRSSFKELKYFNSNFEFLIGNNKISYLIKSYSSSNITLFNFSNINEINKQIKTYQSIYSKHFTNNNYPLKYKWQDKNVLGNFFNYSNNQPNVVIIISEGLSSFFSGKNSGFGSLTPFIDSLSNKSLYWSNFFSNAERTYGSLPNILASAPSGDNGRGFINTSIKFPKQKRYPTHNTLINILKQNNYVTNYYYGGWGWFDNVGFYLKEQGIDNFVCEDDFNPPKNVKLNEQDFSSCWGHNDKELFEISFDLFNKHIQNRPYLSIYQTISNHSPYNLSEKSYYEAEYLNTKLKKVKVSERIFEKIEKKNVSSIFFADDALKNYFSQIKKNPTFNNTIFIITGDHSLGLGSDKSPFKNYLVPLIIYSPMLNTTKEFKGLCSHIDILPSLLSLLENNFKMKVPSENAWIGEGLDTSLVFNCNNSFPLNLNAIDKPNFVYKNYIMYSDNIYKLNSHLLLEKEDDINIINNVKNKINAFQYINKYVCTMNKIIDN